MLFIYLKQVQWAQSNKKKCVNLRRLQRTGHFFFNCIYRRGVVKIGSIHAARLSVWSEKAAARTAASAAAPGLARAQRQLNILVGLVRQ